jgi:hypothetical protein
MTDDHLRRPAAIGRTSRAERLEQLARHFDLQAEKEFTGLKFSNECHWSEHVLFETIDEETTVFRALAACALDDGGLGNTLLHAPTVGAVMMVLFDRHDTARSAAHIIGWTYEEPSISGFEVARRLRAIKEALAARQRMH